MKLQKSNKININSFDELLVFFRKEDTTIEQIQKDISMEQISLYM